MSLRILASAFNDLADGRDFYERQSEGLGGYFLDSLLSDIDSLVALRGNPSEGFWLSSFAIQAISLCHLTTNLTNRMWLCIACWICVRTREKYAPR